MSMLGFLPFNGTDMPDVENVTEDDSVLGVAGTYPNAAHIAAAMWDPATSPNRTVTS